MSLSFVETRRDCEQQNAVASDTSIQLTGLQTSDFKVQFSLHCTDFFLKKLSYHIILPVVLYGCETWSLSLREERRLRLFENRVLRRLFGPKRDEVTGEWRKFHKEELRDLYSLPNIVRVVKSRRMMWAGHVARMWKGRGVHRVLVGKPEGKRPLGRPRRR